MARLKKKICYCLQINYYRKAIENPNITYIKSIITELSKNSHKLSKTIRQAEGFTNKF